MVCAALSVPRHAINRSPNTTHDASRVTVPGPLLACRTLQYHEPESTVGIPIKLLERDLCKHTRCRRARVE